MDTKIDQLKQIIPEKYILRQEPMKNHTTFRIGGPADIFVAPENMEEIKAVSRFAKEEGIPLFVLGNGSNLLVADDGMDGIVLQIYKNYSGEVYLKHGNNQKRSITLMYLQEEHLAQMNRRTGMVISLG